jgi:hypothetical protein
MSLPFHPNLYDHPTVFTGACHWNLSWARWIQSTPFHPISLGSIQMSSHLRLGLRHGLFLSGFATKILYTFIICTVCAACHNHLILLNLIALIIFGKACKLWSSLCSLLQPPSTSSLLGPNILLTPCSQTPSICVLSSVRETKFHTHTKQQVQL